MLPPDHVERIFALSQDGLSSREIARQLGHSAATVRAYLNGQRTPGSRTSSRLDPFTGDFAGYCRQRFADDPHLQSSTLLSELAGLGFRGSRATFYRKLARHQLLPSARRRSPPQGQDPQEGKPGASPLTASATRRPPALPRPVTPVTGEALTSYLTRLASANHLTLAEVLAILPSWFSTKTSSSDDRGQHHMLVPAATEALDALAHLASASPAGLARALPAFAATGDRSPVRAATACHRCTARRGIRQPVAVHLPAHHKACTRHGIWLSDAGQPHLDLAACPEIIIAQHRASRLLRRFTPQQLLFACQSAARAIPPWPASPALIPHHWRHRLLILQTANQRSGPPADHDTYTQAAIYPDVITIAAAELSTGIKAHPAGPE